jgi:hypothetical protein
MIGRDQPVKPFELIRWAMAQADRPELKPMDGHVLLVLAVRAKDRKDGGWYRATCWPSLELIAKDCGRGHAGGPNSAVSESLKRLTDLGLIYNEPKGHGHPSVRELLYKPSGPQATTSQEDARPQESTPAASGKQACPPAGTEHARPQSPEVQENDQRENYQQKLNGHTRLPSSGQAVHPHNQGSSTDIDIARELSAIEAVDDPALKERLYRHLEAMAPESELVAAAVAKHAAGVRR